MADLAGSHRALLEAVSHLAYCNPFLPERVHFEKLALGPHFEPGEPVWSLRVDAPSTPRANVLRIIDKLTPVVHKLRESLTHTPESNPAALQLYEDAAFHLLYEWQFDRFIASRGNYTFYKTFLQEWEHFFRIPGRDWQLGGDPPHIFSFFHQIQRAFREIFQNIIGGSMPAARLRAAVWQSVFTSDMRRFRRAMWSRMGDFATLITGPSGTGKELVARAIAHSRYIPFDPSKLAFPSVEPYQPINISALTPTLVESELFGHKRGSFTGAASDRKGFLETCSPLGSVFLDELGELDHSIQVKLLRVIETRTFHPVGDTASRRFQGKLIAATNRDLASEMRASRFREDLYYRLCSDMIQTPSLDEQLRETPEVLRSLLTFFSRRVAGDEGPALVPEIESYISTNLPPGYPWPGNYRELEQCVRNYLVRGSYRPARTQTPASWIDELEQGRFTASQLLDRYAALVYSQAGNYQETARRLNLDRRTVKRHVDAYLRPPLEPG